ncbi:MAG TPA: hypothetical protein VKV04_18070, partial [Verrucomicrobiae bacterium]|nr:hypothetical protein [Verrucomicrobiae bacterium]
MTGEFITADALAVMRIAVQHDEHQGGCAGNRGRNEVHFPVDGCGQGASNVRQNVEVFIILVFASFPLAQSLFRFNEFNAFYPL